MTFICEDRSSYNQDIDPISRIVLTVECHPKQVNSIIDFLSGIEGKAGVYHAAFDANFVAPVLSPVAVEEVLDTIEEKEEVSHGEQLLQPEHEPETSVDGQGSIPAEGNPPAISDAGTVGKLAWVARKGAARPISRRS